MKCSVRSSLKVNILMMYYATVVKIEKEFIYIYIYIYQLERNALNRFKCIKSSVASSLTLVDFAVGCTNKIGVSRIYAIYKEMGVSLITRGRVRNARERLI